MDARKQYIAAPALAHDPEAGYVCYDSDRPELIC
jgi:hypothetical protein